MHAYVRYDDSEKAIVPISMVKKFHPKTTQDFERSKTKNVFWCDEDGGGKNFYQAKIIMLGGESSYLSFASGIGVYFRHWVVTCSVRFLCFLCLETKDDLIKALMDERIEIPRILSLAEAGDMLAVRVCFYRHVHESCY